MTRRIDHLVLAVHDLDAAADFYRRLGFQVGARNHHPWGTDNHIVQFASSFLEIITVADAAKIPPHGPREFSFGAFVSDYLTRRQGLAMIVLDSADAAADAATFTRAGIGDFTPFTFQRIGHSPDGAEVHVGFRLAFAVDPARPDLGFFVCQQLNPGAFWNPAFQQHDNGATNISEVTIPTADPLRHRDFLTAFTGQHPSPDSRRYQLAHAGQLILPAGGDEVGFTIAVPDLDVIRASGIAHQDRGDTITIDPAAAFGTPITFAGAS